MHAMLAATIQGIPLSLTAIWIAAIMLIMILPAILDPKKFKAAVNDFLNGGDSLMRVTALFCFLMAFLILHRRWTVDFSSNRSIMAVLGYLIALKGVIRFWFPGFSRKMIHKFINSQYGFYIGTFLGLVIALGLGYLGIWMY